MQEEWNLWTSQSIKELTDRISHNVQVKSINPHELASSMFGELGLTTSKKKRHQSEMESTDIPVESSSSSSDTGTVSGAGGDTKRSKMSNYITKLIQEFFYSHILIVLDGSFVYYNHKSIYFI